MPFELPKIRAGLPPVRTPDRAEGEGTGKGKKCSLQDKSLNTCAAYTYAGEKCGKSFIRSDLYLYQKEFEIHGEGKRYLTLSEILVLSLIWTHCNNPETGKYTGSIRGMAKLLGLSPSTVQRCIEVLKRANLIICETKAPNGSRWSAYRVNEKHLKTAEREYKNSAQKKAMSIRRSRRWTRSQSGSIFIPLPNVVRKRRRSKRKSVCGQMRGIGKRNSVTIC